MCQRKPPVFSDEVIVELTQSALIGIIKSIPKAGGTEVDLTMPKFRIDYGIDDLSKHLGEYDLRKMFTFAQCDLSGFFSKVESRVHKTSFIRWCHGSV